MQNTYPPDLHAFVEQSVAHGRFASENDLVVEAMRYYRHIEEQREQLSRELKEAADSLDRGEGVQVDFEELHKFIEVEAEKRFGKG